MEQTLTQGQTFTDPRGNTGVVNFDTKTGQQLQAGQTTSIVQPIQQPQTANIPAEALGTQQIQIPQTQISQPQVPVNMAQQLLEQSRVEDTETQKFANQASLDTASLMENLLGETQDRIRAKEEFGVNRLNQQKQEISNRILALQAEMGQDNTRLVAQMKAEENRDTLLPFARRSQARLQGDAAIMRALKASEIGVLNAQVIGLQGDISLAMDMAKDSIDLKYAPYKEMINIRQMQLQALQPILDRDEKKQAREQDLKLNLALKEIDKREAEEKEIQSVAMTLLKNGAPQSLINQASKLTNMNDLMNLQGIGYYLTSPAERLDMAYKNAQIGKIKTELQLALSGGGKPLTQSQAAALGYGERALASHEILAGLDFQPTRITGWLPNALKGVDQQKFEQAQRNFINAVLRRESGANISDSEFESAELQYFPARGDKPENLKQKADNRAMTINNLLREGGQTMTLNDQMEIQIDRDGNIIVPQGTLPAVDNQSFFNPQ